MGEILGVEDVHGMEGRARPPWVGEHSHLEVCRAEEEGDRQGADIKGVAKDRTEGEIDLGPDLVPVLFKRHPQRDAVVERLILIQRVVGAEPLDKEGREFFRLCRFGADLPFFIIQGRKEVKCEERGNKSDKQDQYK